MEFYCVILSLLFFSLFPFLRLGEGEYYNGQETKSSWREILGKKYIPTLQEGRKQLMLIDTVHWSAHKKFGSEKHDKVHIMASTEAENCSSKHIAIRLLAHT